MSEEEDKIVEIDVESDGDFEDFEEDLDLVEAKDSNYLNSSLLSRYAAIPKTTQEASSTTMHTVESRQQPSSTKDNDRSSKRSSASSTQGVKRLKTESLLVVPTVSFGDFGGIEACLQDISDLILRPFKFPEIYKHLGVDSPKGILLHGPPGCGKTSLASAIAGELQVPLLKIAAPEIVSGMSGESEAKLRELFEEAKDMAPSIIFIDEIDAVTPKRENAQREMERRIVAQLLSCMDEICFTEKPVMVIGATNRPDSLDPALRRAGRFDREIRMGIPDEHARLAILKLLTSKLRLQGSLDLLSIAKKTPGYVGADLKALSREAANAAINRIFKGISVANAAENPVASMNLDTPQQPCLQLQGPLSPEFLEKLSIEADDFQIALKKVQPSAKREGFAVVPDTSWDEIGALEYIREELRLAVVEPARNAELFSAVGIASPSGVLLWGPPGCGKTLLAKAVANESHSNFISVKGPELLNKYVGESERAIRQVFERARASAPCVIFFDELDALCPRRSEDSSSYGARLVNQLLTEMDGIEERKQVYIIAATNRPDIIDPAITRPGRLDKLLYVGLPTASERLDILQKLTRNTPISPSTNLECISSDKRCLGFSGADLASLVKEAAVCAIKHHIHSQDSIMHQNIQVGNIHFEEAFGKVHPSVSTEDLASYETLLKKFTQNRQ